jgi:hypothetical protein
MDDHYETEGKMKAILSIFAFASIALAGSPWIQDTALFTAPRAGAINVAAVFGKALPLAGASGWRVVQKTVGTSFRAGSGWAADSISSTLNYRTLSIVPNASGKIDTLYGATVLIDTLIPSAWDSTSLDGYACVWDTFTVVQNAQYIQFGVGTLAGQCMTDTLGIPVRVDIGRNYGTVTLGR